MGLNFKARGAVLAGLISIFLIATFSSCKKSQPPGSEGRKQSKVFTYCTEGSPSTLNPQLAMDGVALNITQAIYDNLVRFKYGTGEPEPALAESWEISNGGKTYTFKLRRGVKFHQTAHFKPTRDFNADDVIFSLNRQRLKTHPYHLVSGGSYKYFKSMGLDKQIVDIQKVDPYTVRFILKKPEAPFIANLTMDFAAIFSKEYADQLLKAGTPEKLDNEPIGTGAFVFVNYQKDLVTRLVANDHYYDGRPAIDKLNFAITTDPGVRTQKLRTGECHFITEPSPNDLATLEKDPKIKIMERSGMNVGYVAMNTQKKPYGNPLVRQALNYAVNRAAYLEAIYLGSAVLAKSPLPPTVWSHDENLSVYEYDPERAKDLLKKAGYPNGFETKLWALPVARAYNPNGKKLAEMMQADFAKVGVKAEIVSYDWPTYISKMVNGEHELLQLGWNSDNGDPDNFLGLLFGCEGAVDGGANFARYCSKEYDSIVSRAKAVSNSSERTDLYKKAQSILAKEVPWILLAHGKIRRAMRKNVVGYKIDPLAGRDFFHRVDLEPLKTP